MECFIQNQWSLSARITGGFHSESVEPFRQNQWCLSSRIRRFGEDKTPDAFRSACHRFILTEVLRSNQDETIEALTVDKSTLAATELNHSMPNSVSQSLLPTQFLLTALEQSSDESGWSQLGTFGSYLTKIKPDFDSRTYGFKKLSELVKSRVDLFLTEEHVPAGQQNKQLYLRRKK